jgi:hypothetical protein
MKIFSAKPHPLSLKPANKPVCLCGKHTWYVSQRVQRRGLDCPLCGRYFAYVRELNNDFMLYPVGRFKTKAEREKRTLEYASEVK